MRRRTLALTTLTLLVLNTPAVHAGEEAWRHDSASAFSAGEADRVVVSDLGAVRLAPTIRRMGGALDAARVWALAVGKDGPIVAATGDEGKVFRLDPGGDGPWRLAYDAEDSQALALAAMPDGKVHVGTGPGGRIVELTDPAHPSERPGPEVRYVWALAAAPDGSLLAATGPTGQLWRRPANGGAWVLVLDSPAQHLLSLAVAPDGTIYAGSDGEGLIYKVPPDGKPTVIHDAPQGEVQALLVAPDGALYAGTASGGDDGPAGANRNADLRRNPHAIRRASYQSNPDQDQPPGIARPKPAKAGENAVYRIGGDGIAREVFRAKALIYALAWQGGRLLVGTGPEGRIYALDDPGRESTMLARVDHGQVLALRALPDGSTLIGAGDPGGVLRMGPGHASSGTLTSDVLDADLPARLGQLSWRGETPAGTSIAVQVRTGPTGKPDTSWSDWSDPLTSPGVPDAPAARYAQYRVTLKAGNSAVSPTLTALTLYYRTRNLPPEIASITVPDLSAADGAARKPTLELKWEASDPNGDDLIYTLALRRDGWPAWVPLAGAGELTEAKYTWDTTTVPSGSYRLRVQAGDRRSNRPEEAASSSLASGPFVVDHEGPTVTDAPAGGDPLVRSIRLADAQTRVARAEYALDGGDWTAIFPDDGLFDERDEAITLRLPDPGPGDHVLMIRAFDAAGNAGSAAGVVEKE